MTPSLRSLGLAALLTLAGCIGPPLNAPPWARQSVAEIRGWFPVGQTRLEDVRARISEPRSSAGGSGVLDARMVFFQRDQQGSLRSDRPGQQPQLPLVPVTRVSFFWSETNYPADRTGYERDLRFYFDQAGGLVYLERLDRNAESRPFKMCC